MYTGPDVISVDGHRITLHQSGEDPMAKKKPNGGDVKPVQMIVCPACQFSWELGTEDELFKVQESPKTKTINRKGLIDLVLFAPSVEIEPVFMRVKGAMQRLGLSSDGAKVFKQKPFNQLRQRPHIHDIMAWLSDLKNEPNYSGDLKFLTRLHRTLAFRLGEAEYA